jgi:hypothetical protein
MNAQGFCVVDRSKAVIVVYNPPAPGFPFLSVAFVPGREDPMAVAFDTAVAAEEFNRQIALEFEKRDQ